MHLNIYLLSISMHIYGVTSQLSIKIKDQIQLNSKSYIIIIIIIVGSQFWGVPFTVDVSEPKPNRPNTMNLVEKRA